MRQNCYFIHKYQFLNLACQPAHLTALPWPSGNKYNFWIWHAPLHAPCNRHLVIPEGVVLLHLPLQQLLNLVSLSAPDLLSVKLRIHVSKSLPVAHVDPVWTAWAVQSSGDPAMAQPMADIYLIFKWQSPVVFFIFLFWDVVRIIIYYIMCEQPEPPWSWTTLQKGPMQPTREIWKNIPWFIVFF